MADNSPVRGYQLPTDPARAGGYQTSSFATPVQDKLPQIFDVPPRRVLPIIFLPGIMGSNLRMSASRQQQMGKSNNIAWRPENAAESIKLANATAAVRQSQLDPSQTEVDEYDPVNNPTGNPSESSDERNSNAAVSFFYGLNVDIDTPLLMDDPVTTKPRKTKEQKARERGWGEIYFSSYQQLLEMCELRLNTAFRYGVPDEWWRQIIDKSPAVWQAHPQPLLAPLDSKTLREAVEGVWFPVHAMGYNWLRSNKSSGIRVAERINILMKRYQDQGYQCEKVIVVTHSMGGLVARALIHPKMGNIKDKVLGMVHGVMPAMGAGAAYKRMRCGFEDSLIGIAPKVLGNHGPEVTAVLANAQGGLELLPNQAYGNGWLQVTHKGQTLISLPQKGDPYEEIYKLRGKWYGLLMDDWINPSFSREAGASNTLDLLDKAKKFHHEIAETYHAQSYAHYGASLAQAAWHHVIWALEDWAHITDVEGLSIQQDDTQGRLHVVDPLEPRPPGATRPGLAAKMMPPKDPGDRTVPLHSSDHQLHSGKFKGIFRQTGYEHQDSYKNQAALHSTLYSLVRIAHTMNWSK